MFGSCHGMPIKGRGRMNKPAEPKCVSGWGHDYCVHNSITDKIYCKNCGKPEPESDQARMAVPSEGAVKGQSLEDVLNDFIDKNADRKITHHDLSEAIRQYISGKVDGLRVYGHIKKGEQLLFLKKEEVKEALGL